MKFKPKNRKELEAIINEIVTNQTKISSKLFKKNSYGLKDIDVSNITNMENLFSCNIFDRNHGINRHIDWKDYRNDITQWDISNVTNIKYMFLESKFNQDISRWDVSNVTNMVGMFEDIPFNQNINSWNVSSVTSMYAMFAHSNFNQRINDWDVSNVTNMKNMFTFSIFNQDISKWIFILNKECDLNNFNYDSKHEKKFGTIKNYEDFLKKQLTKDFIKETLQNGNDIDKYKLLKIIKYFPHIVKNIDIGREIV